MKHPKRKLPVTYSWVYYQGNDINGVEGSCLKIVCVEWRSLGLDIMFRWLSPTSPGVLDNISHLAKASIRRASGWVRLYQCISNQCISNVAIKHLGAAAAADPNRVPWAGSASLSKVAPVHLKGTLSLWVEVVYQIAQGLSCIAKPSLIKLQSNGLSNKAEWWEMWDKNLQHIQVGLCILPAWNPGELLPVGEEYTAE